MKKKQRRKLKPTNGQRAVAEFIKLLRSLGVTLTCRADGTVEVFSAKPIPPLVAKLLDENREEISAALAKESPAILPYTPQRKCPDCHQPFEFVAFDAGNQANGEARIWRCGCHTLLGQEL